MILQELISKLNEHYREGKGNNPVYFQDGPVCYPILEVEHGPIWHGIDKLPNSGIILKWKDSK